MCHLACVCSCIAAQLWSPLRLMGSSILTLLVIALIPSVRGRPLWGVCLSLLSSRHVGANVGWHSDTLADVFWHCEDPSCVFTYAMTQICIPPHTPSTLISAAQLKKHLSSLSLWPQQPLPQCVCHSELDCSLTWQWQQSSSSLMNLN